MLAYLVRRILVALPVVLGVTVITYMIISLAPGDAVDLLVDPHMSQFDIDQRRDLGLDQPAAVRYAFWLKELVHSMLDVVRQDYIRSARAKGVGERSLVHKHAPAPSTSG